MHITKDDTRYNFNPSWTRFVAFVVDLRISVFVSRCFKFELFGCRSSGKHSTESFQSFEMHAAMGQTVYIIVTTF